MKHFKPFEFLPSELYNKYADAGMRYINPKIPALMDIMREFFNCPITINNWKSGGDRNGSCLRLPNNKDYSKWSDHSFGNACDFIVSGVDSFTVQDKIINDTNLSLKLKSYGLVSIEDSTSGWTHIGVADMAGWSVPQRNGIFLIPIQKK